MKHVIKPGAYVRYGDDFLLFFSRHNEALCTKKLVEDFLQSNLSLSLNEKNDQIVQAKQGLHFLGVEIFPTGKD